MIKDISNAQLAKAMATQQKGQLSVASVREADPGPMIMFVLAAEGLDMIIRIHL